MINDRFDNKLVIFSIILICLVTVLNFNSIYALTQTNNYNNGSATGMNGKVYTEKFSGLPAGGTINQLSLNVSSVAGHVRAKIYQDNGYLPITATALHNYHATNDNVVTGTVHLQKFTGLPAGYNITSVNFNDVSGVGGQFRLKVYDDTGIEQHQASVSKSRQLAVYNTNMNGAVHVVKFTGLTPNRPILNMGINILISGSANLRYKVYDDLAGSPNNLLGETGVNFVNSNGFYTYSFPAGTNTPASGTIWAGFETDSSSIQIQSSADAGTWDQVNHVFGTGPNPFGGPIVASNPFQISLTYSDYDISGVAGNLLGEGFNGNTVNTGFNNGAPLNAIIPSDGVVYAGFELGGTNNFIAGNATTGELQFTHSFGAGPTFAPSSMTNSSLIHGVLLTYQGTKGPSTLLGESNSITVNSTGIQNFPLTTNAIIPASGNVWGAFETDSASLGLRELTKSILGNIYNATHIYGTGPNPVSVTANNTHPVWMQISYANPLFTVSLKPLLHDGITPITSGKLIVTQNGATIGTGNTNSTGWAKVSGLNGLYNFTVVDDKNFAVYKELNTNVASNIAKNVSTNDYPFDCISPFTGYQSDLVLRINDTDGTHITSISTPTCQNQNTVSFSVTFTGNGQSGNTFSSSMLSTVGTQVYAANPSSFTVSNTVVPTIFTQGNNIVSNTFTVGTGLATTTLNFVITLTTTQSTGSASQSGGQNYFTTNSTCFAGVFDPKANSCVFGPINITIPPTKIITNPNQQSDNNIGITCDGTGSITVTSINLGSNPLGIQIGQLPVTVNCGQPTPTTCPAGTTLTNGVCVAPLTCPVGSQTQNGICTGQLTCPAGTTLQNAQCIAQPTCPTGSIMVNNQCQDNGIPIVLPPTPSPCNITNPLACFTSTNQSQDVVVTATTSDGRVITSTTTLTKVINPELNNVSLVIILLIIAAIIAGIIYRYLTRKPKKPNGSRHGSDKKIKDFNRNLRKS